MTLQLTTAPGDLARAAGLLRAGRLVAFPTETVYGLGADATDPVAVASIYAAKGRPGFNPLIAHVAGLEAARREGCFGSAAQRLAEAFWPGPLTLVVPVEASGSVCELARAGLASIALRVPSHPVALALLQAAARPVAAPSANRSGHVSPTTAQHVLDDLAGRLDAVVDGGDTPVGVESTVVACLEEQVHLLRPGSITVEDLERVLGAPLSRTGVGDADAPLSPGRLAAHYAPNAFVRLNAERVLPGEALLAFGPLALPGAETAAAQVNLSPAGDLTQAAAMLYRALRLLDATGARMIAVAPIPEAGLGAAINDRLRRAAVR